MNEINNILIKNGIICKKLFQIDNKLYRIRKKVDIYIGVKEDSFYALFFKINSKSRILQKNIDEYQEIFNKIVAEREHNIRYKYLIFNNDICSKALNLAKEKKWRILDY